MQRAPGADKGLWKDVNNFFHKGTNRRWEGVLTDDRESSRSSLTHSVVWVARSCVTSNAWSAEVSARIGGGRREVLLRCMAVRRNVPRWRTRRISSHGSARAASERPSAPRNGPDYVGLSMRAADTGTGRLKREWRCTDCGVLLDVLEGARLHIRFARGHQYVVALPTSSVCRGCQTLNELVVQHEGGSVVARSEVDVTN